MSMQNLPLDNAWEPAFSVTRRNTDTGVMEAATGLSLDVWLSEDDGGDTIHADVRVALTERVSLPGSYYAVIDADIWTPHLEAYAGEVVYEVFGDSTGIRASVPRKVVAVRHS